MGDFLQTVTITQIALLRWQRPCQRQQQQQQQQQYQLPCYGASGYFAGVYCDGEGVSYGGSYAMGSGYGYSSYSGGSDSHGCCNFDSWGEYNGYYGGYAGFGDAGSYARQ